ncbi:oligosaccharide flippase family protein [Methanolobus sp. WCC5]|uniref:oligosaccharide flippase family protein n=1 Tax=Methanolobus sp. WCC5 TaxID=3125785 RepID=UPI003250B5E4
MSYFKKIIIGTVHSFSSIIVVRILTILTSVIVARFLGPASLGILSIFQNIHGIFGTLTQTTISTGTTKFVAEYKAKNKDKLSDFLSTILISVLFMSVSISIIYFLMSDYIANNIYGEPLIALLIKLSSITLLVGSLTSFQNSILQGMQKIKKIAIIGAVNSTFTLILTYFFVLKMSIVGVIIASIICALVMFFIYTPILYKELRSDTIHIKKYFHIEYFKQILNYSFPLFIGGLILRPARLYGQTALALSQSFVEVGYFRIAFGLYSMFSYLPAAISIPLLPLISEININEDNKHTRIYSQILRIVIISILPVCVLSILFSKQIIIFIYGKEYIEATVVTQVLLLSAFLGSISSVIENLFLGSGNTWQIFYINVYMAITFVVSSYFLVPMYGVTGLGFAWFLVDLTLLPIFIYFAQKNSYLDVHYLYSPLALSFMFLGLAFAIDTYISNNKLMISFFCICVLILFEFIITTNDEKKMLHRAFISVMRKIK